MTWRVVRFLLDLGPIVEYPMAATFLGGADRISCSLRFLCLLLFTGPQPTTLTDQALP